MLTSSFCIERLQLWRRNGQRHFIIRERGSSARIVISIKDSFLERNKRMQRRLTRLKKIGGCTMFGFWKKEKAAAEVISTASINTSIEEEMGMKEYVSFDSVKAHLVDILEENRRLKQEAEAQKDSRYKVLQEERKQKELSLIEADEWKKRVKEKDEEIRNLKKIINEQDSKIEELEKQQNRLQTEAEMARLAAEKTRREYEEKNTAQHG